MSNAVAEKESALNAKTKKRSKKSKKSKKKNSLLIAILAVLSVVVVLLAIVVIVQMSRGDSKSEVKHTVEVVQSVPTTSPTTSNMPAGIYPFTSLRKVTYDDVAYLSAKELRIMRNEIYARHGYIFKSKDLRTYFLNQGWYVPVSREVELSEVEMYNVNFIRQFEL